MTQGQTNDIKVISFSETVILLYCNAWVAIIGSSDHRNLNGIETDLRNYGITDLRR